MILNIYIEYFFFILYNKIINKIINKIEIIYIIFKEIFNKYKIFKEIISNR